MTSMPPTTTEQSSPEEAQEELSDILKNLRLDLTLTGIFSLGTDGVLRSLTADREVVDAVGLRPVLVKALLDRLPYDPENEVKFRGVNGALVPREQWFHPDKSLLPPPYNPPEERKHPLPEELEKNRQWIEDRKNRKSSCGTRIRSDHNIGLKCDAEKIEPA